MRWIFTTLATLLMLGVAAPATAQIERILALETAPTGVVFEIAQGDESALSWALPKVERYTKELKAKVPDIKVAVVTHGREQFGLVDGFDGSKAQKIRRKALQMTQAGTKVHVCGGHNEMRGVPDAAFPKHINVAPSGPAQVQALRDAGYALVQIRKR